LSTPDGHHDELAICFLIINYIKLILARQEQTNVTPMGTYCLEHSGCRLVNDTSQYIKLDISLL